MSASALGNATLEASENHPFSKTKVRGAITLLKFAQVRCVEKKNLMRSVVRRLCVQNYFSTFCPEISILGPMFLCCVFCYFRFLLWHFYIFFSWYYPLFSSDLLAYFSGPSWALSCSSSVFSKLSYVLSWISPHFSRRYFCLISPEFHTFYHEFVPIFLRGIFTSFLLHFTRSIMIFPYILRDIFTPFLPSFIRSTMNFSPYFYGIFSPRFSEFSTCYYDFPYISTRYFHFISPEFHTFYHEISPIFPRDMSTTFFWVFHMPL